MSIDARLNKLMPALTARERAVLVLRSLKDKTQEDPQWRRSMPADQVPQFNRLIELMNRCNLQIAFLITVVEKEVEKLELLTDWWFSLLLWQVNLAEIDLLASIVAREAVTQSEHRQLVEQHAGRYISVQLLASELAEYERAWRDEDLQQEAFGGGLVVKDDAWQRLKQEAETRIRAAVEAGELEARGTGKRLAVRSGSFDAWLGRPARAYPAWAAGYDVLPDDRAAQATADRSSLQHLQEAIQRTPLQRALTEPVEGASLTSLLDGMEQRIMVGLGVRWLEVCEVELVMDEVALEFGGEDPLKPASREALERSKATILSLHRQLAVHGEVLQLPEPDEEGLDATRRLVDTRSR